MQMTYYIVDEETVELILEILRSKERRYEGKTVSHRL